MGDNETLVERMNVVKRKKERNGQTERDNGQAELNADSHNCYDKDE